MGLLLVRHKLIDRTRDMSDLRLQAVKGYSYVYTTEQAYLDRRYVQENEHSLGLSEEDFAYR